MGAAIRDPYLWSALAAAFLGLALGQAIRWLISYPRFAAHRAGRADSKRAHRSARALVFFSRAMLAAAALLVFPQKASLFEGALRPWAASLLVLGTLAGVWPRAAGLPVAVLLAAAVLALDLGLSGWLVFHGPGPVATLLPFELTVPAGTGSDGAAPRGASFRGELELAERDSVPVVQKVEMGTSEAALAVESLEFRGPAGFVASLLRSGRRFYRLVGLVGPDLPPLRFPPASGLLGRLAALGPDAGFAAGAPPVEREALFGSFIRRRSSSASVTLVALEPVRYALDENMGSIVESR
jgi:hypothetical protein